MNRPDLTDPYRRRTLTASAVCLSLLTALTIAVGTGMADQLDVAVRDRFRPDYMWGPTQQRAAHVASALSPPHMLILLAIGSAGVSLWRLSLWPLVQAGAAMAATGALTLAIKVLVDRPDPWGGHTSIGGAYPSGHSATLLAATATGAMLVSCPTRWWQRAGVALMWVALSVALLYDGVHWVTDIVGGALTAGVVLGLVAAYLGPTGGLPHVVRRRRWRGSSGIPHSSDQRTDRIP